MRSRFVGLLRITKQAMDMQDVHEHVKGMVMPDFGALVDDHTVPYIPAAAVGAVLGKLTGAALGSVKRSPWRHELEFKPSWKHTGVGYTVGGGVGAGVGALAAFLVNKAREHKRNKSKRKAV